MRLAWQQTRPTLRADHAQALRFDIYVWPLLVSKRSSAGTLLVHHPLPTSRS
jgi:hypothetical protein